MAMEKRQYPRVEVAWPVTIVTPDGLVIGRTENLSLVGTLILCPEVPELFYSIRLFFRPAERQLLIATAERVWSSTFVSDNCMSHAMGVRFTYIPDNDYRLINEAISSHI
jgi:hypothetical protein